MVFAAVTPFVVEYAEPLGVALFYITLIALIFFFRKKFEWQGKVVALLRTNWGVNFMQRYGEKHKKLIILVGYIGIGVAFVGMLIILGYLGYGLYQLVYEPSAPPVVSPVLPGVSIPGAGIHVPLLEGLIALFIVIVIHESAHGLVAAAHGLKIKSSGLLFLGPIAGAFVEPDEERIQERPHRVQQSVFAAGPWSNILTGFVFLGMWIGVLFLLSGSITSTGISIGGVSEGSPAALAGISSGEVLVGVNNIDTLNTAELEAALSTSAPGDEVTLETKNTTYTFALGTVDNSVSGNACIGITDLKNNNSMEETNPVRYWFFSFIQNVLFWIYALSFGLGLANLIPIGPVDGGRMIQLVFRKWFGDKRGDAFWSRWSTIVFVVIILLLIVPIIRAVINPVTFSCVPF